MTKDQKPLHPISKGALVAYVALLLAVLITLLYRQWPTSDYAFSLYPPETEYVIFVAISGALGGSLRAAILFFFHVKNRILVLSWVPSLLLQPIVGATLGALLGALVYFLMRGSLALSVYSLSPFGVMILSGMTGYYYDQALRKLNSVIDVFFRQDPVQESHTTDGEPKSGASR